MTEPRPRLFRLTAPDPFERDIHASVATALDALVERPAFWFSAGIGAAQLSPQQAARFSHAGIKRGLPDIFVIAPPDGRLFGIELKRHGGVLSKTRVVRTKRGSPRVLLGQEEVFAALEAAGMPPIAVCRSVEEVLAQLAAWGVPLRGRPSSTNPAKPHASCTNPQDGPAARSRAAQSVASAPSDDAAIPRPESANP